MLVDPEVAVDRGRLPGPAPFFQEPDQDVADGRSRYTAAGRFSGTVCGTHGSTLEGAGLHRARKARVCGVLPSPQRLWRSSRHPWTRGGVRGGHCSSTGRGRSWLSTYWGPAGAAGRWDAYRGFMGTTAYTGLQEAEGFLAAVRAEVGAIAAELQSGG